MGQSSKDCWGIFHHAMFDYPRAIQVKIFNQWNFKGITPGWMTVKFQVPIFNPSIGSSMNLSQPNARSSADASHGRYPKNSVSVGRMMINNPISGYPWVPDFQTNSLSHWLLENGEISSWNWWISPTMWDSIAISKPFPQWIDAIWNHGFEGMAGWLGWFGTYMAWQICHGRRRTTQ